MANSADDEDFVVDAGFKGTSRWRPMSLDTLSSADDVRRDGRAKSAPYVSGSYYHPGSLSTEGIDLCKPAPLYKYLNRGSSASPTLTKHWDDLERNKPRIWIRKNVNKPFDNLKIDDIKGTRPNPKNMKLGKNARGTSPLTPEYSLPSYEEPPSYEPKFLRDSMLLEDIEGSRPSSRISSRERNHLSVMDIDGTYPGWKPAYRRNFGKKTRDLCLQVHDITPQKYRYVRDPYSEVYEPIDGTCPKQLTRARSQWSPVDSSLRTDDIEGTAADSALLKSKVKVRKQKSASRNMVTTQREKAELVAVKLLKTRVLDQMRGKSAKDVVQAFKKIDRQSSGKLTICEVENAFKSLDVGLNGAELKVFSTAFDTSIDGFLNYWHLVKHLVPVLPSKRRDPRARSSKIVSMALSSWSQPETQLISDLQKVRNDYYADEKVNKLDTKHKQDSPVQEAAFKAGDAEEVGGGAATSPRTEVGSPSDHSKEYSSRATNHKKSPNVDVTANKLSLQYLKLRGRQSSSPLPIGGPFWPEEKLLRSPETKSYLSLFHDHHDPPNMSAFYRVLDDSEKRWVTRVGDNLYTGEGNTTSSTSYSQGYQWGRPPSSQRLPGSSRCSTPGMDGFSATRPSTAMSTRPSTGLSTRPPTMFVEDNRSIRPSTASQLSNDENMSTRSGNARRIKRPQSASVMVRGSTPECLRTISNMEGSMKDYINNVDFNGKPSTASTNHRVQSLVRGSSPFSRIKIPPRVQSQLAQMMEDIAAVKALM